MIRSDRNSVGPTRHAIFLSVSNRVNLRIYVIHSPMTSDTNVLMQIVTPRRCCRMSADTSGGPGVRRNRPRDRPGIGDGGEPHRRVRTVGGTVPTRPSCDQPHVLITRHDGSERNSGSGGNRLRQNGLVDGQLSRSRDERPKIQASPAEVILPCGDQLVSFEPSRSTAENIQDESCRRP